MAPQCGHELLRPLGTGRRLSPSWRGWEPQLRISKKSYRPAAVQSHTREEEIERKVKGLLNMICPDNLKVIVVRLALIELLRPRCSSF